MGNPASVTVRGLRVTRGGREVLHGLDCDFPGGAITGLIGPSGCGKSTLMRSVAGVQVIASGTATVLGGPPAAQRCAGGSAMPLRVLRSMPT